jgi:antirestriction protein ArdC
MIARKHSVAAAPAMEDTLVSSLIALMEQGTTPWRRDWDRQWGGHHVNLFTGRAYRGANPILLTIGLHQRDTCLPYWSGAGEARTHGLHPRRGSKAVVILRPQVCRRGSEAQVPEGPFLPAAENGGERQANAGQGRSWVRYRPVALFNAADLEGEGLEDFIAARQAAQSPRDRTEPERLARAEAVLRGWPVPMDHGGPRAFYNPSGDQIQLPDREAFHSAAAFYATWAHEALHSTGHASRLARNLTSSMGSEAYAREELLAELGAVLLGERLEIGSDVRNHAAYLAEWIQLLRESPRLLYKLLSEARQAADLICPPEMASGSVGREAATDPCAPTGGQAEGSAVSGGDCRRASSRGAKATRAKRVARSETA